MKFLFHISALLALATLLNAQEPVAPTWEPVGSPRGEEWKGYNITNSFEVGQRFLGINGDQANYDAAVNYGNGTRLLDSNLAIFSKTGKGKLFDTILLTTQGLGGDPYQSVILHVKLKKFYNYVATWRDSEYVNPGLITDSAGGSNSLKTDYKSQNHDLILMPQSIVRVLLGYRRDAQEGMGFTTTLVPTTSADLFPVLSQIHRVRNEYRLGVELHAKNSMLQILRTWSEFKDESPSTLPPGASNPTVTDFNRYSPYKSTNPSWTLLFFHGDKFFDINGNFTYANGQGTFVSNQAIFGQGFLASPLQQIQTSGDGRQPVSTGNLNINVGPTESLTITSHTSYYDGRTEGSNAYFQQDAPGQVSQILFFQSLDVRTITTDIQADQKVNKWFDVYGGYNYSNRLISSVEQVSAGGSFSREPFSQTNAENDGYFGIKIQAMKSLTLNAQGEVSQSSQPFTPKSDGNYVAWKASATYRVKNLQLAASGQNERNATSTSLTSFATRTETWMASADWTAKTWLTVDGSYSNIHTNVLGGLAFFADGAPVTNAVSYYIMNLHAANLGVHMQLTKWSNLYFGGTYVQDTGDGRSQADMSPYDPGLTAFQVAQTFPLTYYAPLARLSIRLNQSVRWNLGYQLYKYQARFSPDLNFTANTGFTSILWSF